MALNIGENIKTLRTEKGVTQEQLAEYLSITYQSVSKWENNITTPDLYLIPMIAEFFGVSVNRLFRVKRNPGDVKILVNPEISEDQLWRFYVRNGMYEARCYDKETAAIPLYNSDLIVGAFCENELVGILRVIHDKLYAKICEFYFELELQGANQHENGALLENDRYGIAKKMGLMMVEALNKVGIDFISCTVVDGIDNSVMESIGFTENKGHIEYVIDNRP
ncbi:MAG: helix-turn-helix domain-containing protein [Oscillospiraceae bacterium]|nr:helix-turn-helix domain-containing protein [Oscillospiraceae bacterium]